MAIGSQLRRRCRAGVSIAVVTALLLGACGDDDADTAEPSPDQSSEGAAAFEARVEEAAQAMLDGGAANGATAAHVAISDPDNGDLVVALGTLAVDGDEPASADDTFPIGSITKTFTASVILQMIADGDLSLDDTVGDLLPDLADELPDLAGLTVQQLLSMTSGIEDYLNVPDSVVTEIVADPTRVWEPEELIAAGVDAGVQPPGTPGYSTTNYIILQLIAESIGGRPLEEMIATDVTEPLGLDHAVLPSPEDTTLPDPHTNGYIAGGCVIEMADDGATVEEGTDTTDWNTSFTQGGGGMYATIGDMLAWAQSLNGTSLLSDELAEQRLQTTPIPGGIDYGLGIFGIGAWYGHEGEALGWEALSVQDPDTGVSVALALNGCGGQFAYFLEFLDTLYPDGGAMAAMMGGATDDGSSGSAGSTIEVDNQVAFVGGESAIDAVWTDCTWDGTALTMSAAGVDSQVDVVTDGGAATITVTGTDEWSATGTIEEEQGLIVVTGRGTPAGGAETDITLVVYDCA